MIGVTGASGLMIGVTGASGFIGSYFWRELQACRAGRLRILSRLAADPRAASGDLDFVRGDLRSLEDCERFTAGVTLIYHLAHCNTPLSSDHNQINDALSNLIPTLTLLEAIRRQGTRPHVVYISSGGAVYGPSPRRVPFSENDPCHPRCSYGIQKLAAEHYLRVAADAGILTATVLRVGNAYGTQLPQERKQGLIGVAIKNLVEGKPVRVFGSPENVRDYVHLQDLFTIARRVAAPREPFSVYNVGSAQGHSVREVLGTIEEAYGERIEVFFDQTEGFQLADWVVLDCSKAERELGWSAKISLASGIREMLASSREAMGHASATA